MNTMRSTTEPTATPAKRPVSERAMGQALRDLEHAALAAVQPAELERWVCGVADALEAVRVGWSRRERRHHEVQTQIVRADDALHHRLAGLSKRARRHQRELLDLVARGRTLRMALEKNAPSAIRREDTWALRDDVVQWSVSVRIMDNELDAWFSEALYRDRGVAH